MNELAVFRNAVDALPYGVTLWQASSERVDGLQLVYANPQASREANVDLSELIGRPLTELLPGRQLARGEVLGKKGLEAALQKTRHSVPRYRVDVAGEPRDFRVHLVPVWDRTVAMVYERLREDGGEADIPSQAKVYFEDIVRTFHEPLLVIDAEQQVLWVNDVFSALVGIAVDDIVGRPVTALPGSCFGTPRFLDLLQRVLPERQAVEGFELVLELGDTPRTLLLNAHRMQGTDNETRLVLLALRDVTEERKAQAVRRSLVESVLAARDEERRRIARELHDQVGQSLEAIAARLQRLARPSGADPPPAVRQLLGDVRALAEDVARLAAGLHPVLLDELGFEAAVRQQLDDFGAAHGLHVDLALVGLEEPGRAPEPALALAVYRMLQEGLTNVARHAKASSVNVVVHREPTLLRLMIEDDGIGFHPAASATSEDAPHLGLLILRERAELLGGELEVESAPGQGTTLVVSLPVT